MNSLIFDIVSLIDYNNDILKKNNLNNNYTFDVTKLEYLKHIRQQSLNSLDNLSNERLSDENIAMLESSDNLSDNSSDNSYNTLIKNWSYNSLISLDSDFDSIDNIDNIDNIDYIDSNNNSSENNNLELQANSIESSINNEIYNILKNDYLNFLNYYNLVNNIKYKNLKLYQNLTRNLIYINLDKIKESFIKLMNKNK